jgi:hypothetical protein
MLARWSDSSQYESTDALSGGSFWGVSDHCPVYFEVVDVDDDG